MLKLALVFVVAYTLLAGPQRSFGDEFDSRVRPLLKEYCVTCHSGDDPNGDVDFSAFHSDEDVIASWELWGKVNELLLQHKMPPEDEPQPSRDELAFLQSWYQETFVDSVQARPGLFRPRRLSASEYRNTLRTLFGFDLTVNVMEAEQTITEKSLVLKLLPTDPPGESGYRNDTHSTPLSTKMWEQYSYLVDSALEELFSPQQRDRLTDLSGPQPDGNFLKSNGRNLVRYFAQGTRRRPVSSADQQELDDNISSDETALPSTKREVKRLLMSPSFLYRGLRMDKHSGQQKVDDFEFAERLSYFIWGDMPDEELFDLAASNRLSTPSVLRGQVSRMLDSPRARNLATDFGVQWLLLNEIEQVSDNPPVMVALKSQPLDFFHYLIRENRPLLELIDSNITFANPLTRKYYLADIKQLEKYRKPKGIEIEIVPNQKLKLNETTGRGGILTMPGVLAMNRGPILRGIWMLERILGEHLPDPPADVGQVKGNIPGEDLSFRERFAEHRSNESCALCHDKIDPLGFALGNYDDNGGYLPTKIPSKRKKKNQPVSRGPIDTSGQLPSGEKFDNFAELKQIMLTTQSERITRNITQQMLAYALCRKLEIYDQPTVEAIVDAMNSGKGTWRDLVFEIANSLPFRETLVQDQESNQESRP